jgi:hypothetical protein
MASHDVRVYRVLPEDSASRFRLANPDEFFARYPQAFRSWPMCAMYHSSPDPATVSHPSGALTDFGWLMSGALVWSRLRDEEPYYQLQDDILLTDSEGLELSVSGSSEGQHRALNPVVCNVLDIDRSKVRRDDDGRIVGIDRYVFFDHRLGYDFFRLPYGSPWEIFTIYQINEPEDLPFADLYSAYTKLGLKGLRFDPVWEGQMGS